MVMLPREQQNVFYNGACQYFHLGAAAELKATTWTINFPRISRSRNICIDESWRAMSYHFSQWSIPVRSSQSIEEC